MSLLHSARIEGPDPYAYMNDLLERPQKHPARRIDELLPLRWSPASSDYPGAGSAGCRSVQVG
jgi:transposase